MMGREDYEIAVISAMWRNHGIGRVLATEYVQRKSDIVFMCFQKGRDVDKVAKALAEELISAAKRGT